MPFFCEKCGAEVEEDAVYCPRCGAPMRGAEGVVELATWTQRFIALVIDGIILGIALGFLSLPGYNVFRGFTFGANNVLGFLYFMFMDHYYGQSVGKKVMNLRITRDGGAPLTLLDAAIESFGKVFLLPIDFLVGYLVYRGKNQRLFNYLSDTVVIREA